MADLALFVSDRIGMPVFRRLEGERQNGYDRQNGQ
jgi:hypothetical protein